MDLRNTTSALLLGIPLDLGAENLGVDVGPDAFRYQGIIPKLLKAGIEITDGGNIAITDRSALTAGNPKLRYMDEIIRVSEESAVKTKQALKNNKCVIAVGGDHSINLGVVSGAAAVHTGQLGLIYLDAHGDMNTDKTTLTGNIHGMHLASLMGYGAPELARIHGEHIKITKDKMLHIGGSDFDNAELELIKRENLNCFTLLDYLSDGLRPLLKKIDDLASRVPNIWVSLDLDVIDAVYAPGAGMPNKQGLTYREIITIAEYIGRTCNVVGVDVVEYNPLQDVDRKTAELGIELIARFFGKKYSWYTNYLEQNHL